METAGKLAGFAVCAALVALILRRLRPEAGWGVSLGAGAIVLLAALPALSALSSLSSSPFRPVTTTTASAMEAACRASASR